MKILAIGKLYNGDILGLCRRWVSLRQSSHRLSKLIFTMRPQNWMPEHQTTNLGVRSSNLFGRAGQNKTANTYVVVIPF